MKKATRKKSSVQRSTKRVSSSSSKLHRSSKRKWYHLLPFRFSVVSVTVLSCLTLVTGGLFALGVQTNVLGTTTAGTAVHKSDDGTCISVTSDDKYSRTCYWGTTSGTKGFYYSNDSRCKASSSEINNSVGYSDACNKVSQSIYVKVLNDSDHKAPRLFEGHKIIIKGHSDQMGDSQVTVDANGNATFPNQYGYGTYYNTLTMTPAGDTSGIYSFNPSSKKAVPGQISVTSNSDCGTQSKPCIFYVKIIALPNNPAPKCTTQTLYNQCKYATKQACTEIRQVGDGCHGDKFINCQTKAGYCGVSADKPCTKAGTTCMGSGACRADGKSWSGTCRVNGVTEVCCNEQ